MAADEASDETAEPTETPVVRGTDLVRLLVVPQRENWRLRPLTVELYEDGVIVTYFVPTFRSGPTFLGLDPTSQDARQHIEAFSNAVAELEDDVQFNLRDDIGTEYVFQTGGSHGGAETALRGEYVFTPAVPNDASELLVETASGTISLPLSEQ
jgi:hypothetical protein